MNTCSVTAVETFRCHSQKQMAGHDKENGQVKGLAIILCYLGLHKSEDVLLHSASFYSGNNCMLPDVPGFHWCLAVTTKHDLHSR